MNQFSTVLEYEAGGVEKAYAKERLRLVKPPRLLVMQMLAPNSGLQVSIGPSNT